MYKLIWNFTISHINIVKKKAQYVITLLNHIILVIMCALYRNIQSLFNYNYPFKDRLLWSLQNIRQTIMKQGKYHLNVSSMVHANSNWIVLKISHVENEWEDKWSQRVQLSENHCIAAVSQNFLRWSVSSAMTTDSSFNLYVKENASGRSPLLGTWKYPQKLGQLLEDKNLLLDSNKISCTSKVTMQLYVYEWANLGECVLTWKGECARCA